MKKIVLIAIIVVIVAAGAAYLWQRKSGGGAGAADDEPLEVEPPVKATQNVQLYALSGEGKGIFDAQRSKLARNAANVGEALKSIDITTIFDGVQRADVWKTPVLAGAGGNIPLLLGGGALSALRTGASLSASGNGGGESLWGVVNAVRGAAIAIAKDTGVNLLAASGADDTNRYVDIVLCPYVGGCPANDKKRNEKVVNAGAAGKAMTDFAKICQNWLKLAESAEVIFDEYTLGKLRSAGYNII